MAVRTKRPAQASLTLEGTMKARVYYLDKDAVLIGRTPENDIVLNDTLVSRQHAKVERTGHRYTIEDLKSTNGTYLNGLKLDKEPRDLGSGDVVSLGKFRLRFRDPASTEISANPPGLAVDNTTAEVRLGGQLVSVTPKEFTLLRIMSGKPGLICERDEIARAVWPEYEGQVADYQIDNLVARLRQKIERDAHAGVRLVAVKKRGYRLLLGEPR